MQDQRHGSRLVLLHVNFPNYISLCRTNSNMPVQMHAAQWRREVSRMHHVKQLCCVAAILNQCQCSNRLFEQKESFWSFCWALETFCRTSVRSTRQSDWLRWQRYARLRGRWTSSTRTSNRCHYILRQILSVSAAWPCNSGTSKIKISVLVVYPVYIQFS
jgi:hypothetical protein